MQYLGQIRYGEAKSISQSTFWRWCDMAGLVSRKQVFEVADVEALGAIAQAYSEGKTTDEVLEMAAR